jgi:hypothetical protein
MRSGELAFAANIGGTRQSAATASEFIIPVSYPFLLKALR